MVSLPVSLLQALKVSDDFTIVPLTGNENDNYLVKGNEGSFVIKCLKSHSVINTEFEAAYRRRLADGSLPVASFLRLGDNSHVLTVKQQHYVAMQYMSGNVPSAITSKLVGQSARLLAKAHRVDTSTLSKRQSWFREGYISDVSKQIDKKYEAVKQDFNRLNSKKFNFWESNLPRGIIHGDLHRENIIVNNQSDIVGILDWEETAIEPLVLDIAYTIRAMTFNDDVCDRDLFNLFIKSYQDVRPLQQLEKDLLEPAIQYTALVLSTWAYLKASQSLLSNSLLQELGAKYKYSYKIPKVP